MSEKVPAEDLTLNMVALDGERAHVARALGFLVIEEPHTAAREIVYLRDQLTDLRASLAREENARKVLAETNQRALAEISRLRGIASTTLASRPTSGMMRFTLEQISGVQ